MASSIATGKKPVNGNSPRTTFASRAAAIFAAITGRRESPAVGDRPGYRAETGEYSAGPPSGWRKLVPGDLVTVFENDAHLAQVVEFKNDYEGVLCAMVAPLFNFRDKEPWTPDERWWTRPEQIRLIPSPPVPAVDANGRFVLEPGKSPEVRPIADRLRQLIDNAELSRRSQIFHLAGPCKTPDF